jgi:hypothetical protein
VQKPYKLVETTGINKNLFSKFVSEWEASTENTVDVTSASMNKINADSKPVILKGFSLEK